VIPKLQILLGLLALIVLPATITRASDPALPQQHYPPQGSVAQVVITKEVAVASAFGKITIPVGTRVGLMSGPNADGQFLIMYQTTVFPFPSAATNYAELKNRAFVRLVVLWAGLVIAVVGLWYLLFIHLGLGGGRSGGR
jgi:hypothetical protein